MTRAKAVAELDQAQAGLTAYASFMEALAPWHRDDSDTVAQMLDRARRVDLDAYRRIVALHDVAFPGRTLGGGAA